MGEPQAGVVNSRPSCAGGMVTAQRVTTLERAHAEDQAEHTRLWEVIERVQNRPPVWATVVIGILTGLVGLFAGIAFRQ